MVEGYFGWLTPSPSVESVEGRALHAVPAHTLMCICHKQEADAALTMYSSLAETGHRQSFVAQFEENGNGKGKDSLKFALTFRKELKQTDTATVGSVDSWVTRPRVLEILGMRLGDFKTQEEALKVAACICLGATVMHARLQCVACIYACMCITASPSPHQSNPEYTYLSEVKCMVCSEHACKCA